MFLLNRSFKLFHCFLSEAPSKNTSDTHIGELRPEAQNLISKLADNRDADTSALTSLSTYGVVDTAKEAIEGMEISMDLAPVDNPYGLEVNSMVEIQGKMGKLYGLIRWMGVETKLGPMAGVELVSSVISMMVNVCWSLI